MHCRLLIPGMLAMLAGCGAAADADESLEQSAAKPQSNEQPLVDKGSIFGPLIDQDRVGKLSFSISDANGLFPGISDAVARAASSWMTPQTSSRIYFDNSNTGSDLRVFVVSLEDWINVAEGIPGCFTLEPLPRQSIVPLACAAPPSDGGPGAVYIPSGPDFNCPWTDRLLEHVLTHEIGHALGFAHPNPNDHVPWTRRDCGPNGPCRSIMEPIANYNNASDCQLAQSIDFVTPQLDDAQTAQIVYPLPK